MANRLIYLDYAAATPVDPDVLAVMQPYFIDNFYNPSASYLLAKKVSKAIESARADVAQIIGSKTQEIIFTSGGTEANNLAIKGIMDQYPGANLVVSTIEHESVLEPAKLYNCKLAKVSRDGIIDLSDLEKIIDDKTVLVSVMYANNEIGTIQPLKQISELISKVKKHRSATNNRLPIYFHSDACQSAAYLDIHATQLGLDLMTLNGGKIYGPKQTGILYVNRSVKLQPQILGGGQESGERSGTENVPAIIGFSKALSLVQENRKNEAQKIQKLQKLFMDQLLSNIPNLQINGSLIHRLPNNVNITILGTDNETLLMQLDELGIMCASGSACNANRDSVSHVLLAIGLDINSIQSSLRFSFGKFTTESEIEHTVKKIVELIN